MPEINPPLYVPVQLSYGADELALPFRDLIGEGVVGLNDLLVAQRAAGANMSVDIAAGACWITGDDQPAAQGSYRCRSDSVVNLAIAANASGNPRIDRVIAEALDAAFVGVQNLWRLRVIQGVPNAVPVAPAFANNAISLAVVAVANGAANIANANITDQRLPAAAGGGQASIPRVTVAQFAVIAASPNLLDGYTVDIVVDAAAGVVWRFRYNAGSASAYKWEFVGGPPLLAADETATAIASIVAGDGGGAVVSVVTPRAGDYIQTVSAGDVGTSVNGDVAELQMFSTGLANLRCGLAGINSTAALTFFYGAAARTARRAGLASGAVCKPQYARALGAGSVSFSNRAVSIVPVRIS